LVISDALKKVESEVTCFTPYKRLRKIIKVIKKKAKKDAKSKKKK